VGLGFFRQDGLARRVAVGTLALGFGAAGFAAASANDGGAATASTDIAPVTTTTTAPPEVPTTTTTTAVPSPAPPVIAPPVTAPPVTTTTTVAPPRVAATVEQPSQERIEAIADGSGWNWRAAGISLSVGFHPADCCHWGLYDSERQTVWIGPTAFGNTTRLRYVVLHELAHAWQYTSGHLGQLMADYQPWGRSDPAAAVESGGDCIATLWGATDHHYWQCPTAALQLAARRLNGDWS
jgi:hypothetical protein